MRLVLALFFLVVLSLLCSTINYGQSILNQGSTNSIYRSLGGYASDKWLVIPPDTIRATSIRKSGQLAFKYPYIYYLDSVSNTWQPIVSDTGDAVYTAGFGLDLESNQFSVDTLLMATRYDLDNIGITLADTTVFEGSSIMQGYLGTPILNLPIDTNHTMLAYVSKSTNTTKDNNAVTGSTLRNITRRIFTNNPTTDVTTSLIVEGGINDLRGVAGFSPGEDISLCIGENIRCIIANQFLDTFVSISDASITKSGTWSALLPADSTITSKSRIKSLGNPITSSTLGDNITFSIVTSGEPVIIGTYYVQDTSTNNFGSYSITVDGNYYASDTVQGKGSNYYRASFGVFLPQRPATFMITGLDSGLHTIELELEQNKQVDFDYIGVLANPSDCAGVIVSEVPYTFGTSSVSGAIYSTPTKVDLANYIIDTIITRFKNLQYPVELAPVTDVITMANGGYADDSLHFSNVGQMIWAKSVFSKINPNQRISLLTASGSLNNAIDTLVPRFGLSYTWVNEGSPLIQNKRA